MSSVTKHFSSICDMVTKISNRDMLYDLVPYLTNVRYCTSAPVYLHLHLSG